MKRFVLIFFIGSILVGCGSRKKIVTRKSDEKPKEEVVIADTPSEPDTTPESRPIPTSTENYINLYKDIAVSEMEAFKIPASITLAQGILESGSGKGRLAVKANNHFGIKCHGWTGQKIYHDDDEKQECFRKYENADQSFRDHSEFLANRKRYAKLFQLRKDDYRGWARELRKAGYATDKRYPQKLIALIERYQLYKYDKSGVMSDAVVAAPTEHVVIKGDTLYSISRRYQMSVEELMRINNLTDNSISIGQVLRLSDQ